MLAINRHKREVNDLACGIFEPQLRRLRLRHKTSAWASGGPTGGKQYHYLGT
jgi:hypothetical protein